MSAIIKTLKTKTNETEQRVYPKTVLEAVVDAETNETLDVILDNLNEKIDNIEPGGGSSGGEIPTDVQEQLDGKVSKSGDTMTGTLNIDSPNFPAIKLNRTGTTTNYTAIQFNNDDGMLGGLAMNTVSGDINVVDANGVGYPMLDKRNYSNYVVPKTGGAFTGAIDLEGGYNRIDITGQTLNLNGLTLSDGKAEVKKYVNKTNAGSTNISNVPVGSTPFILDVELIRWASTTDYITRQVFICSSDGHHPRVRYCISGTWGDWTTYKFTDTTYSAATQSAVGLMSAADKKKLDGIATGANAYTHPTYTARTGKPTGNQTPAFGGTATVSQITSDASGHVTGATDRTITIPSTLSNGTGTAGLIKTSSTVTSNSGYTACPVINGVPYYKGTNVTVDSSMSTTSTNPVQNKVVKGQLPTSNQNATSGYIRFPSAKIQVAWIKKTMNLNVNSPWGGIYECGTDIGMGTWAAAFSSAPAVCYTAHAAEGSCDLGVNSFRAPTATDSGSVYINRGTAMPEARAIVLTAIAIGTYA